MRLFCQGKKTAKKNAFANNMSTDTKLRKAQSPKISYCSLG